MKNRTAIIMELSLFLLLVSLSLPSYNIGIEDKTFADCDSVFTIPDTIPDENITIYVTGVSVCNMVSECALGEKKRYSRFVYLGNTAYEIECTGIDFGYIGVHCVCSSIHQHLG